MSSRPGSIRAHFLVHAFLITFSLLQSPSSSSCLPAVIDGNLRNAADTEIPMEPTIEHLARHVGYYSIKNTISSRMFYYFFESRNNKTADPLLLWLSGGPGCTSALSLFYENGPFKMSIGTNFEINQFGWDKASNLLYVDNPVGAGFSYTKNETDFPRDEEGVSNDLYNFLQEFLAEHPQYQGNDFFISGESYAGKYIPHLGVRIQNGNAANEGIHINLKGIAIGNGNVSPLDMYKSYGEYLLENNRITESLKAEYIKNFTRVCLKRAMNDCYYGSANVNACVDAFNNCQTTKQNLSRAMIPPLINPFDISSNVCISQVCYDFNGLEQLFNISSVKATLGAESDFHICSQRAGDGLLGDRMWDAKAPVVKLLEAGIKVLAYYGELDTQIDWKGGESWTNALEWNGNKRFQSTPYVPFVVGKNIRGSLKNYGLLTFLRVKGAGHMVPMNQPRAALEMIKRWLRGKTDLSPL